MSDMRSGSPRQPGASSESLYNLGASHPATMEQHGACHRDDLTPSEPRIEVGTQIPTLSLVVSQGVTSLRSAARRFFSSRLFES